MGICLCTACIRAIISCLYNWKGAETMSEGKQARRGWERINENNVKYKTLLREMRRAKYNVSRLALEMGQASGPVGRKMRGGRNWKLWEAFEIKRILKSRLTIEELFQEAEEE